jgi:hypothetical protein
MDEYVVAAGESLMVDYCDSFMASSAAPGTDPRLGEWRSALEHGESWRTPTQMLLKIPLPLTVAAVLSECATTDGSDHDQSSRRNELFRRLQRIWFQTSEVTSSSSSKKLPKYYEWSPTLLLQCSDDHDDANEQLRQRFRTALDQRRDDLMRLSEQATQELLQSEAVPSRRPGTRRPVRKIVAWHPSASSDPDDDTASDSSSTSTEDSRDITALVPSPNQDRNEDSDTDDVEDDSSHPSTEWKPVRRKVDKVLPRGVDVPSDSLRVTPSSDCNNDGAPEERREELILLPEEGHATDMTDASPQSAPQLEQRIQQLERQLAKTEQQLADERAAADKQLQSETNQLHERIQALQLRLYISETRLQTYEEALRQHIASVADNTAISPGRRPMDTAETPPLYARGR